MDEPRVGTVTHYYRRIKVAVVKVEGPIRVGDRLHVKGAHDDLVVRVKSMEIDHKPIEAADAGQMVGIRLSRRAHPGSQVTRAGPGFWDRLFGRARAA